jgi:hypothetical protein
VVAEIFLLHGSNSGFVPGSLSPAEGNLKLFVSSTLFPGQRSFTAIGLRACRRINLLWHCQLYPQHVAVAPAFFHPDSFRHVVPARFCHCAVLGFAQHLL